MVSEVRNTDAGSERKGLTPRQSASRHLPELVEQWPNLLAVFPNATLAQLSTPDGEWGDQTWLTWPRVRADEYGPPWVAPRQGRKHSQEKLNKDR